MLVGYEVGIRCSEGVRCSGGIRCSESVGGY